MHARTYGKFSFFPRFHDFQHNAYHRWDHRIRIFGLAIPDRNRLYQTLLPVICAKLSRNVRRGILKGQRPNQHEPKAIFVTIKQNNHIEGYTIRMSRSVLRLHPIVHKYRFWIFGTLMTLLAYTVFSDCNNCYNNISHYKYFIQNLIDYYNYPIISPVVTWFVSGTHVALTSPDVG